MKYSTPANLGTRPVTILGAGTLGRRIALMFATQGTAVNIYDLKDENCKAAKDYVEAELPKLLAKIPNAVAGTVTGFVDMAAAVTDAWLIIEAIPEKLELKRTVFGQLDKAAPPDAILASNSSSYPARQFIDEVSEAGRLRVVNTHFYMPPTQNAVEVMSCGFTDAEVLNTLLSTLPKYGLSPFLVRKESVGFIFNRVWAAIKRESLAVVAEGVSTPEDIDRIFMVNTGSPGGPFRLMDQVGLDVVLAIEEHYAALNPTLPVGPRDLLKKYIAAGKLGVKSGEGFYVYPKK